MNGASPFFSGATGNGSYRDGRSARDVAPDNQRVVDRLRRLENFRAEQLPIDAIDGLTSTDVQAALEEIVNQSDIAQAQRVVLSTYGDTVSVQEKQKNLNKFGRNLTVSTSWETIMELMSGEINETFVSTNAITKISSDAAGDNGLILVLEGHTIDGSGLLTFVTQDVTLDASDGRTQVTLTTALARATRMYVKNSGTFNSPQSAPAGNIYVHSGTVTAGVPDSTSTCVLMLLAGDTQTEKCATAVSNLDYWFIQYFSCAIGDPTGPTNNAQVRMEIRDVANGGVWRPLGRDYTLWPDTVGIHREFSPYLIVPKNHDWRVRALCDAGTAEIYAEAGGVLAAVQ